MVVPYIPKFPAFPLPHIRPMQSNFNLFAEKIQIQNHFPMKALSLSLSTATSPPLYNTTSLSSSSIFLAPLLSLSSRFFTSPFLHHNPIFQPHSYSMATCIHSSARTPPKTTQSVDDRVFDSYTRCCRPNFVDHVSRVPIHTQAVTVVDEDEVARESDDLWLRMKEEARSDIDHEPILSSYYHTSILCHDSIESALANHLSMKLSNSSLPSGILYDLFLGILAGDGEIIRAVMDDLRAVKERDPACISFVHCFLNFKGFSAIQAHRIGHNLWCKGRKVLALLIQSRVSEAFAVDIHPGARIGRGILLDHATGVVVGETAVIGNNVSILHNVTLGGTGKTCGDRHPKISDGVLIGAGTCVLGNVRIEEGAKIGAGSVVLKQVPARATAVGNPARLMGGRLEKTPSFTMDQTSHISQWSDYVI
ncbi:serine acetyltransferase 1, chloroplastic-like [Salvia miltiorrhiza]|uniref:serine acetyltransferase 1, chloroplastic-like n=1 Tax=Salvia miltiorrhiza TaxID=226208 RepID=UPI0025AC2E90|nr:serine acetyltransferase 1, chloroplastic-like [Salvia miltiorrhiza]